MSALLHALESVATLLLMCARRDLGTAIGERPPASDSSSSVVGAQPAAAGALPGVIEDFIPTRMQDALSSNPKEFFQPNLYLFDAYPRGIGFSEPPFRTPTLLAHKTRDIMAARPR